MLIKTILSSFSIVSNSKPVTVNDNPWVAKILPIFDCENPDFTKFGSQDPQQITATEVIVYLR